MSDSSKQAAQPAPSVVTKPVRGGSRVAGPVILALCVLVAVLAVLFAPVLVGGAASVSQSSSSEAALATSHVEYASVEEATEAVGFVPSLPAYLPAGSTLGGIAVLDGSILQLQYQVEDGVVVYRTAPGANDLSGEYGQYSYTATETVEGVSRSYAGAGDKRLNVVVWAVDEESFALVVEGSVQAETLRKIAESIG